ncbi:MAG: SDR family NAD(P)-dependent oxidoreductase, partial [Muribaculaceae bacterium]|nr:SDR family NAD(P)-dependent oxidoreductase [Muribaculaceae bacterium]
LSVFFARKFKKRGSGRILNMSSMSCWMPMPGLAMYASTKAYIRVFSRSLHYELKDYGASVTVAAPGGIATDLFGLPDNLKKLALRLGAIETPQRFAEKAVKAMLKGKKQYINGLLNHIAIFFIGITPTCVRMQVKRCLLDKGIRK